MLDADDDLASQGTSNSKLSPENKKLVRETLSAQSQSWSKEAKSQLLEEYDTMKRELEILRSKSNTEGLEELEEVEEFDSKGYKLDANTPIYRGRKEENVEQWITIILNNLRAAGVPKNKTLYVLTNYLKEGALTFIRPKVYPSIAIRRL